MENKSLKELTSDNPYKKPDFGDEVVITGIAGMFPNSSNINHFRDNLLNKIDMTSEDCRRWKPVHPEVPQRTGKLYDIEKFDSGCFGVTRTQSNNMDPAMRMLLEKTYEALVDAGKNPSDIEGSRTGVFLGFCYSETEKHVIYRDLVSRAEAIIGTQRSTLAQRLSYHLKVKGPAYALDTACSTSLFALNQAYVSMREGLCDKAIVCATNLCLNPMVSLQHKRLGVLSLNGYCKSFDDSADGYVRSEAVVAIILEKAQEAKRIYSEIVYTKTNCDGYKEEGITFPSSEMQKILLKDFYAECRIDPITLTYVEAHGTGTKVGDSQELKTVDDVFCKDRGTPLYIGSIKSNIGHTESASGLCGIIKVLLSMEMGFIAPNIHYETPRKGVKSLEDGRMLVVTDKMPLSDQRGLFGVSNFGFGGANSHVLLRWNSKNKKNTEQSNSSLPRLICVSSRVKTGIYSILNDYGTRRCDAEFAYMIHQAFRKSMPNHLYKGYGIYDNFGEIKRCSKEVQLEKRKLYLVFSNFNKDWLKIGDYLMDIPIFARSIESIQTVVSKLLNFDISEVIRNQTDVSLINQILGSIAIQISLAEILRELNLMPDHIVGFGSGELLAAYLDNYLTLEQTILALFHIISANLGEINGKSIKTLEKFLPSRKKIYEKWIPLCEEKFNFGCAKYFANIISANESDLKKLIPNDAYTLVIGPRVNIFKTKNFNLIPPDSTNYVVDFFNTLGSLYINGFDMELDKLYPPIELPVSRGTPMLSPLIKWNHNDCKVYMFGNETYANKGHRVIRITPKYEDWNFIVGHVVDGRNLFPATGYLILVWESFAIMLDKLLSEMKVVFEDVKYIRASNIPNDGSLELTVTIQTGTQVFEILEDGITIVTGRIYEKTSEQDNQFTMIGKNAEQRFFDVPSKPIQDDQFITMTEKEVYRELRLRGYHYAGKFKGIRRCSIDMAWGVVEWENNWISFLDSVLQLSILERDTRNTLVPTSISQVIIDAPKHLHLIKDMKSMVPVYLNRHLKLLRSGGIEVNGLVFTTITRRLQENPVLEISKFVENHAQLEFQDSIRSLTQLVIENSNTIRVKVVEICGKEQDENDLMCPVIQASLNDIPMIQHDITVLSLKPIYHPGISIRRNTLGSESHCLILVVKNFLETTDISIATNAIKDVNGFVITRESLDVDLSKFSNSPFMVVCCHILERETLVLLRQNVNRNHATKFLDLSEAVDKLDIWIPKLQNLLKENLKVVVYAQGEDISGILGLVKCLICENYGNRVSCVLIMDKAPEFDPKLPFYKEQLEKNMTINIWKDGSWGTYRHLAMPEENLVESEHCYVNVTTRGNLSTQKWLEGNLSPYDSAPYEEDTIFIYYSALNFRDLMTASGKVPPDAITTNRMEQDCVQGFEFSGRNSKGQRVMGIRANGALGTLIKSKNILPIPDHWTMEDAATVMVTYGTVLDVLFCRFEVKPGQSILIHSAAGGVGLSAINLSLYFGLKIFVTVGTLAKRDFLRKYYPQIEEHCIGNSRDTSFEDMINKYTNGRGVDYILNSLAEEKLLASVRCLAKGGKFLEIGRFDFSSNNALALHLLEREAQFVGIAFTISLKYDHCKILLKMQELIERGAIKPLPRIVFKTDEVEKAFRYMGIGEHIGKVLIKIREEDLGKESIPRKLFKGVPRFYCKPECSYVIYGGLGGFGFELADLLVMRGAKKLLLTSRSGISNGYQCYRIRIWESYGVTVVTATYNASNEEGCTKLLNVANELGPVDGIFNLAVVLKDASFENHTVEYFKAALLPKAHCTINFDRISRKLCPSLRYFVVFSSVFCGRGHAGQTNYGMANSIMERICEKRKQEGYPGLAIQWGAIADVGIVARRQEDHQKVFIGGMLEQNVSNCLRLLDRFLKQDQPIVASTLVDKRTHKGKNLFDEVTHIMGLTNLKCVSMQATFPELGMDSIMVIEIKQTLEREYEVFLTVQGIRSLTLAKLEKLSNSLDSSTNVLTPANQNTLPMNIQQLLHYVGNAEVSNVPVINMKTLSHEMEHKTYVPHVIFLPGIEGVASTMEPLARKLKARISCMQYSVQVESITELAKSLLPYIECYANGDLIILAYSFGAVVAIEILAILESKGKSAKVIFIDGAPDMLTDIVRTFFPIDNENLFQILLLQVLMKKYIPYEEILKHREILTKFNTYNEKISYLISVSPEIGMCSTYLKDICISCYQRLRALSRYKVTVSNLRSKITLFKAKHSSSIDAVADYGLSKICQDMLEVSVIEGDHVTILLDDELAMEINKIIFHK